MIDSSSSSGINGSASSGEGLRQRLPTANLPQEEENDQDVDAKEKDSSENEMGKTPDGTIFKIPQTHDMLSSLFDPRLPKSSIDILTLSLLSLQLFLFCFLSSTTARYFFLAYFACWRLAYNAGLGIVLKRQSESKWIVNLVNRKGWMKEGKVRNWIESELRAKMGKDYDFNAVPLEFNVWIMFRHMVDVILLNDFLAYVCFAVSYLQFPPSHSNFLHALRWIGGFTLVFFNLWVKIDAHRIVKDFAWYWGDAFFMSLSTLVFDGVFEFAPHPMYSVGYAGYYGLSLIVASETVLFVSLAAHACQFGFLLYFENPHIERTYGERKPLAARTPLTLSTVSTPAMTPVVPFATTPASEDRPDSPLSVEPQVMTRLDLDNRYFGKDLLIFNNFDIFRNRDLAFALVAFYAIYSIVLPSFGSKTQISLAFVNALIWRVFHSFGLGLALKAQSETKWITRHFFKHYHFEKEGGAVESAFRNWKATYNLSLCLSYASFCALAWKCYTIPADWNYGTILVRHTLGLLLIALHVWTAQSTFEVLGPFGWFYGDFFIEDYPTELYYTGIYRFLNNPERSMGGAAFFGLVLICGSKLLLIQAVIAVLAHWWFLSAVENPHMKKLYGNSLRKDAGVTKTLRNVALRNAHVLGGVTKSVKEVSGSVEKVLEEAADKVEEFLQRSAPKLHTAIEETKTLLAQSGERLLIARIASDLSSYPTSAYTLALLPSTFHPPSPRASTSFAPPSFHLGEPISIAWSAPAHHSKRDWIGIYRKGANSSSEITKVSSQGKWRGVEHGSKVGINESGNEEGIVVFGEKELPWKVGVYEIRYHHDGKHNVMSHGGDFEIYVEKPTNIDDLTSIQSTLTSIVSQTLAYDLSVIPSSARSLLPPSLLLSSSSSSSSLSSSPLHLLSNPHDFILYSHAEAQHIAYAIEIAFDVELSEEVVLAAANTEKLGKTIWDARRVLAGGRGGRGGSGGGDGGQKRMSGCVEEMVGYGMKGGEMEREGEAVEGIRG